MYIKKKFISNYEIIMYYFLSCTFLIEFINGITVDENNNKLSFGIIIRAIFLIFFLCIIFKYEFKKALMIFIIFFLFFINVVLSYYLNHFSVEGIIYDIKVLSKIMFFLSCIFAVNLLYKNKLFRLSTLKRTIYNNLYSIPVLMILSYFLGIGKSTYGDAGFKGAFNQVNTINAALIVMFIFALEKFYVSKNKILQLFFVITITVILILLGTKSSFFFVAFSLIMYIFYDSKNITRKLLFVFIMIILIFPIKFIIIKFFYDQIQSVINRQRYFMSINQDSFITYLLSSRDKFFIAELQNFINDFSIRRIIIGIGKYYEQIELARNINIYSFKGIEMDLFDIFFSYGVFGLIVTYFLSIYLWIKNRNKIFKIDQRPYTISFICLIIFSILGGHIFVDSAGGTFLALMLSGMYMINKGENFNENRYTSS
jgi:hypothetical protein